MLPQIVGANGNQSAVLCPPDETGLKRREHIGEQRNYVKFHFFFTDLFLAAPRGLVCSLRLKRASATGLHLSRGLPWCGLSPLYPSPRGLTIRVAVVRRCPLITIGACGGLTLRHHSNCNISPAIRGRPRSRPGGRPDRSLSQCLR